jgi:TatD DNase family protein
LNEVKNPVRLVDTHCHLDLNNFDNDRQQVIERAKLAGIFRILVPGTNLVSSEQALQLAMEESILYAAIGLQPNDALEWQPESQLELENLFRNHHNVLDTIQNKIVAIGEIGLDYYWDVAPHPLQKQVLLMQMELAAKLSLPVVLHVREQHDASRGACFDDLLDILRKWKANLDSTNHILSSRPGVIHSFSGNLDYALEAISLGFFIGVTGPVTFKNAKERQETIKGIGLEHLLLETDAPFLAPQPNRGKRNEPGNIRFIAERIAELHEISLAEVATITNANAKKLFEW